MAVYRVDLDSCIGCRNCYNVCPMDVFRYDFDAKKAVIAYVTECQVCGQCVVNCLGRSLGLTFEEASQPLTNYR